MAPLSVLSDNRARPVQRAQPLPSVTPGLPYGLPAPRPGVVQRPAGISLCMIVKDEERFLASCLRTVAAVVDEICIVDTGSTDRTLEIALDFGAQLEKRAWRNDFAWARNEALAMATKRWTFVLDADEELDAASVDLLRAIRTVPADLTGLWVRCQNLSDDYKGTGVSSHALVRLFPTSERIRYLSPVHEFITLDGSTTGIDARMTPISITHHGYLSEIVQLRNKSQRNLLLVKAATETNPTEPFNWYNLGTTSLLCGDRSAAIAGFEKMREIVGAAPRGFVPNALAQLADLYTDQGDYDDGIRLANESLRAAPHFANAHFSLGRALIKLERFDEGRAAFEAAIADTEYSSRQFIVDDEVSAWKAQSEIGTSYGLQGNDQGALEWFERGLANRPKVVPLRLNRARALERLARYDEAESAFRDLAADEPGDVHTVDCINYLLRRGSFRPALDAINEALAVTTPRVQASLLTTAAQVSGSTGMDDVQALLERAVSIHHGAADALLALEAHYIACANTTALAELHERELDAPLTHPTDYARRGARLLSVNRLADAEAVTRAGLELAAADPVLHYNLGVVLVKTDRKAAALDELALAGHVGDVGLRATFLAAVVLGDLGRYDEALLGIDEVIAQAPHELDARLHRFRFLDVLGCDAQAEATLREALELGGMRVAAQLSTWLLRKGRYADAAAVADRALPPA